MSTSMRDEAGFVWIGVHFGSRGLGHTQRDALPQGGRRQGRHECPARHRRRGPNSGAATSRQCSSPGASAYAGREWVVGACPPDHRRQASPRRVHNHHNYAWRETHGGKDLWVVRKGATPAFPRAAGFVGGSMGDDAVILEGVDSPEAKASLYSTVHGAGRLFGRNEAEAPLHARGDGPLAHRARRHVDRRRSRREPDGLSALAGGACRSTPER